MLHMNVTFKYKKNFLKQKKWLTSALLLQYPDPLKLYQLELDASDLAIGAVLRILTPKGYLPLAYESRMLSKLEQNYPFHNKKLFAIIHALKKWRCYVKESKILKSNQPKIAIIIQNPI